MQDLPHKTLVTKILHLNSTHFSPIPISKPALIRALPYDVFLIRVATKHAKAVDYFKPNLRIHTNTITIIKYI